MFLRILLAAGLTAAAYVSIKRPQPGPCGNPAVPEPAKPVDLARYLGVWREIARYEASFQRGMEAVTAAYSLLPDGKVKVTNTGRQGGLDGPLKTSVGKAYVVKDSQSAKLRVSFFGPFYGDYWVLDHDDDYRWSIVGEPSGRYLWLLHRDARPDPAVRDRMLERAQTLGYDLSLLRFTQQPADPEG